MHIHHMHFGYIICVVQVQSQVTMFVELLLQTTDM